jgi:hypothetical protein
MKVYCVQLYKQVTIQVNYETAVLGYAVEEL